MSTFDSKSLLQFHPPRYLCKQCCAIFVSGWEFHQRGSFECPVCRVEYVAGQDGSPSRPSEFLDQAGYGVSFQNKFEQASRLAAIGMRDRDSYTSINLLLSAIEASKAFVHVATFNVSDLFIGALKLAALSRDVRLVIGC